MIKVIVLLCILALITSCRSGNSIPHTSVEIPFQDFIGRSVNDGVVADFIADKNCAREWVIYLCKSTGIAIWFDASQITQIIYLYVTAPDGFEPYKGVLPFGLKFYDTMGAVEYKLRVLDVDERTRFYLKVDLSDMGGSPDHTHYWVDYEQHGMVVIYNTPFADEDAMIYAVLIKDRDL